MTIMTDHSMIRAQQRGIDPMVIELLILAGKETYSDNEACHLELSKKSKKNIIKRLKSSIRAIEKSPYVVLSHDGTVITTAHRQ
ncbi:hypothetical protein AB4353_16225 [Vibrio breoganii]